MTFIIGIDLMVIVVGIIAASMFVGLATEKGYVGSKARKYVIIVSCATLFLMMMGQSMISFLANLMEAKSGLPDILIYCWSGFILVICITVLYKAYQNMKKAPNSGQSVEETEI